MILRSIELENFGLYGGRHQLDLLPARGRPVVLFGGKNGAGKTTLLEAVRLALYGRRALGYRVAQSEYEEHLRRRLHSGQGRTATVASVGLEFDYSEGGVVHRYRVVRHWSSRGSKTVETLSLEKDGKPIDSVPRDEWHGFLQELIPPGVSQLFFFDGEKIAEIAREGADEGLADAVRGLLGIELVSRLRTDLGLFLARRAKRDDDGSAKRLQQIVRDIGVLDRKVQEAFEDVAELTSRRASQARSAANVRQRFIAEGGDAASRRASLEAERNQLRQQIARREHEIRELAGALLPIAAAPRLMHRFGTAVAKASEQASGVEGQGLRERILEWRAAGDPPRIARWTDRHWADLDEVLASIARPAHITGSVGELEAGERRRLLARLSEVQDSVVPKAGLLVGELEELNRELRRVEAELVRASGHAAGVVLDELLLAEKEVGAAEAQLRARSEELRTLEHQRSSLIRERDRMLKAQSEVEAGEERAALAVRASRALQQYEERLMDLKLAQLQREFVGRFNRLARKGDFVADARIDRNTFEVTLIDAHGAEIPKADLSAGEKQVFAIAMLWALAATSGRALPMIIDTPLARLDSEHRAALVERYFPEASHQVIILSTDTEVDSELLDRLRPSVSHSYHLDFDGGRGSTTVRRGYFGDGNAEDARALQQT